MIIIQHQAGIMIITKLISTCCTPFNPKSLSKRSSQYYYFRKQIFSFYYRSLWTYLHLCTYTMSLHSYSLLHTTNKCI